MKTITNTYMPTMPAPMAGYYAAADYGDSKGVYYVKFSAYEE